jgi:glutamine synthetase
MKDLDEQLWRLGILSKTKHNEVAPCQHEMAPMYSSANSACDSNQLIMEIMKKCAAKHNLVCLLHEKPFACVSGSGKHNNWSLATDTGKNLFSPGKTPRQNAQFLLFLAAFVKGVDEYQDFLRCSAASAGNDRRLGANEAPPVIISIYLGDELHAVVDSIIHGSNYTDPEKSIMRIGVDVMPPIPKDTTDRNRTSPLAFTGNKFEFRMMGSSQSVSDPNITLNTIMAEELSRFADILEQAEDFDEALHDLVTKTFTDHQRILFNGNGYSEEWCQEAHRRGLSDLRSTPEAMPKYVSDKNVELVTKHGIFTEAEFRARNEIHLETYRKILNIEAKTTADIAIRQILPAVSRYSADLAARIQVKKGLGCSCEAETDLLTKISAGIDALYDRCRKLSDDLKQIPKDSILAANYFAQTVVPAMDAVRSEADALELLTDKTYWPFPTYSDLLFY